MSAEKAISKSDLKSVVTGVAKQLPEDCIFIAAAREVANGKVEIEFVQSRALGERTQSVFGLLMAGDAAFGTGRTIMRVWNTVTLEGFKEVFGDVCDIEAVFDAVRGLDKDMRVPILKQVKTMNVNGVIHPIKITCIETVNKAELPKSIRTQLADPNVSDDIKSNYYLRSKEGEVITDEVGNLVYRRFELVYGDRKDVMVPGKKLISAVVTPEGDTTEDILNKAKESVIRG